MAVIQEVDLVMVSGCSKESQKASLEMRHDKSVEKVCGEGVEVGASKRLFGLVTHPLPRHGHRR